VSMFISEAEVREAFPRLRDEEKVGLIMEALKVIEVLCNVMDQIENVIEDVADNLQAVRR
jgi:hypothetical protein